MITSKCLGAHSLKFNHFEKWW